jgi:hypothetical protein
MEGALSATFANLFGALEINLPGTDVRLLDGSAAINIAGQVFTGDDEEYGTLHAIESFDDGMGDQAPRLSLSLLPASTAAAELLLAPEAQGSRVRAMLGAFVRETGVAVEDPIILFDGEVDQGTLKISRGSRQLEYDCAGGFERFFETQEGIRLSPTSHKSTWPDENGLDNVTGVAQPIYWGLAPPRGSVSYSGSGGSGGGGGSFLGMRF